MTPEGARHDVRSRAGESPGVHLTQDVAGARSLLAQFLRLGTPSLNGLGQYLADFGTRAILTRSREQVGDDLEPLLRDMDGLFKEGRTLLARVGAVRPSEAPAAEVVPLAGEVSAFAERLIALCPRVENIAMAIHSTATDIARGYAQRLFYDPDDESSNREQVVRRLVPGGREDISDIRKTLAVHLASFSRFVLRPDAAGTPLNDLVAGFAIERFSTHFHAENPVSRVPWGLAVEVVAEACRELCEVRDRIRGEAAFSHGALEEMLELDVDDRQSHPAWVRFLAVMANQSIVHLSSRDGVVAAQFATDIACSEIWAGKIDAMNTTLRSLSARLAPYGGAVSAEPWESDGEQGVTITIDLGETRGARRDNGPLLKLLEGVGYDVGEGYDWRTVTLGTQLAPRNAPLGGVTLDMHAGALEFGPSRERIARILPALIRIAQRIGSPQIDFFPDSDDPDRIGASYAEGRFEVMFRRNSSDAGNELAVAQHLDRFSRYFDARVRLGPAAEQFDWDLTSDEVLFVVMARDLDGEEMVEKVEKLFASVKPLYLCLSAPMAAEGEAERHLDPLLPFVRRLADENPGLPLFINASPIRLPRSSPPDWFVSVTNDRGAPVAIFVFEELAEAIRIQKFDHEKLNAMLDVVTSILAGHPAGRGISFSKFERMLEERGIDFDDHVTMRLLDAARSTEAPMSKNDCSGVIIGLLLGTMNRLEVTYPDTGTIRIRQRE